VTNMTFVSLFPRERSEELRSRISLLKCSLATLKQDFWTIFDNFYANDQAPPYVFPASTFQRLGDLLNDLETINTHVDPDFVLDAVSRSNLLDTTAKDILFELVKLQSVLAQRICNLGAMKLLEYHQILQIEYGTVLKAYNAVDALSFELVERILGSRWIVEERYSPISLFDARGYEINVYSYVISVPYYDSFRARFWPALAHETAHILVSLLAEQRGRVQRLMIDKMRRLLEILHYRPEDIEGLYPAFMQMSELTSDVIATYVCPAAFLSAATILGFPMEEEEAQGALIDVFREAYHPPSDARMVLMKEVLDQTGILEADKYMKSYADSVITFFARKNLLLGDSSFEFIQDYNEFAEMYSQEIIALLPQVGLRPFDGNEWNIVLEAFENPNRARANENELSPIQLICLDWIKRIQMTKNNGCLTMRDFCEKRKAEPKIFEQMVDSMYKYYEKEIVQNIRKGDRFDLRIDIDEG